MDGDTSRIPVTLLTGFLGAGKTTLLNHLICDPGSGRIAVIMNEFGAVGLDHHLIADATEEVILMQSGCLCCTFRGDISSTLGDLMAKRNRGEVAFDRVVIETTGIAEPAPIIHTLVVDSLTAHYYRLDGVVTVADAAAGPETLKAHAEAVHQIALADRVVVTKADLVTRHALDQFHDQISAINATASQIIADQGRVARDALFDLTAMREAVSDTAVAEWLGTLPQDDAPSRHDHKITSAAITVTDPVPAGVFDIWLDMLIAMKGEDILRIKGIVHLEGVKWPFVFHGVQHIFDAPVPLEDWTGGDTTSRVVVIARNMTKDELETSLSMLRMQPKEGETVPGMMTQTVDMPF